MNGVGNGWKLQQITSLVCCNCDSPCICFCKLKTCLNNFSYLLKVYLMIQRNVYLSMLQESMFKTAMFRDGRKPTRCNGGNNKH